MLSTLQTINFVNSFISVYIFYFVIIAGLIGNTINSLVFTQLTLFRRNQSAFYLTIAAVFESFQLIFISLIRVIATDFGYDPARNSLVWCKLRIYLTQFGSTVASITVCFAAIDQYLSTSYHIRLRQISTFKLAQRLVVALIIFATLYSIPSAVFEQIQSSLGCAIYNPKYNYFYSFVYLCIIIGLLPIVISSLFSILAYRNVRRIIRRQIPVLRRRLDRQLTAMILVRVALFVITTLPYVSVRTYEINRPVDQKNAYAAAVDQLIRTTFTAFFIINFAVFDFCFDFRQFAFFF
jgi:hypothetical protein